MFIRNHRWLHSTLTPRKDFKLADIGEGIVKVHVLQWFVRPGDTVKQFDRLVEVQSDKATVEITSRFDGVIKSLAVQAGEEANVGQTLVVFEGDGATTSEKKDVERDVSDGKNDAEKHNAVADVQQPSKPQAMATMHDGSSLASPAVRHLIKENGLVLGDLKGTGKDGRVTKDDVVHLLDAKKSMPLVPPLPSKPVTPTTLFEQRQPGKITIIPIIGIRKEMVKAMTAALKIPHFVYMDDIRVDKAMQTVKNQPDVSLLCLLIKATSIALESYPELNATTNDDLTELRLSPDHNIGIAVDTPKGLFVPVIRDVRSKSITDIANEMKRLREGGIDGKFSPNDLSGVTFTLSNIGSIGGTYASPVIVPPQVAIGVFGRARRVPVFESEVSTQVTEAKIMNVSWAADHRVLDGATVARFSSRFKKLVENPNDLLVRLR